MEIAVSQAQGRVPVTVIKPSGALHLGNADQLQELARQSYEKGAHDLLIDLDGVERITSAGLRAILAVAKMFGDKAEGEQQSKRAVHVKLARPSANVRQVLDFAGMNSIMDIHSTTQEAIASF